MVKADFKRVPGGPKCGVSLGYDLDMSGYVGYSKMSGYLGYTHGHLSREVIEYVKMLVEVANRHDAKLHFFLQGNTFEDPTDYWKEIIQAGHAVDQHTYSHMSLLQEPLEKMDREIAITKNLMDSRLGIVNIGLRGPGGYRQGLQGRDDIQQLILKNGIKFVSTQYSYTEPWEKACGPEVDQRSIGMIADLQPYYYPSGLLEIPLCGFSDRHFLDGMQRSLDDWIEYLKRCVDFVYEQSLTFNACVHPITHLKHDPQGRVLEGLLSHCQEKPEEVLVCTQRDVYRWVTSQTEEAYGRVSPTLSSKVTMS